MDVNPIPAGVLENPSKSHVLCPNMTNDTSLESSCTLLLESAKKNSFYGLYPNILLTFLCKTCTIRFLCHRPSKKLKIIKI